MAEANQAEVDDDNPLTIISKQLDCPICVNRLSDPKDLDCSHTFCSPCLADYARSQKVSTVIPCPLCRQNTVLPPGGIAYLKTNYLLRDVIDAIPVEDARLPKRKNDFQDLTGQLQNPTQTCSVHNGVLRDIYCATCNVLICHKCIGTGHCSTGHSHYSLPRRASYARNYLKTLSSESVDKLTDLDSMMEELQQVEETLRENRQATMNNIGEHVQNVITNVMQQQNALVRAVENKFEEDVENLKKEKDRITKLRDKLQQYHEDIQSTANNQDDETVVLLESKLDSEKDSHQRQELNLRATEFNFQETEVKIGTLTIKSEQVKKQKPVQIQRTWKKVKEIPGGGFKNGLAVSPDGSILGVCKSNGVYLYGIDNNVVQNWFQHIQGTSPEYLQSPKDLVFLNDEKMVILDGESKFARIFTQEGRFVDKFHTLEADDHKPVKVRLSCISYDRKHEVIVIGDSRRKALTFHQNDGTILQTIYLNKIDPIAVDINVDAGLVAVTNLVTAHILSMTGKMFLVLERYGDSNWPLAANSACFDKEAKSVFVLRSMPFGEKSILQYAIPSGKYMGCLYKGLSSPFRMTVFGNNTLAVTDGLSIKTFVGAAESEI